MCSLRFGGTTSETARKGTGCREECVEARAVEAKNVEAKDVEAKNVEAKDIEARAVETRSVDRSPLERPHASDVNRGAPPSDS
jgi:hypothetical protein